MGEQIREQFVTTYQGTVDSIIAWTPTIFLALLLLISALVVAKVVERILRSVMVRLRFDALVEKVGIDQAIQRLGMREGSNRRGAETLRRAGGATASWQWRVGAGADLASSDGRIADPTQRAPWLPSTSIILLGAGGREH